MAFKAFGLEPVEVKKLSSGKSRHDGYETGFYIVNFSCDQDLKKLADIVHIGQKRVRIEIRRKKDIVQCTNCQRFGHTSANCGHPFRCVKCADPHGPQECQRRRYDKDSEPYCCNCAKDGHTSNNLNACEFYKNQIVPNIHRLDRVTYIGEKKYNEKTLPHLNRKNFNDNNQLLVNKPKTNPIKPNNNEKLATSIIPQSKVIIENVKVKQSTPK